MPGQFSLLIRHADGTTRRHTFAVGTFTLGREPGCDLVIDSADVSRRHVKLILSADACQVVDLGSTLGTRLNGKPVSGPQRASLPVMLQLGSVSVSVKAATAEDAAQPRVESAAPPEAHPDARVPYEFGHEIARGGMGSVLEAQDCKLGRKVAVKVMLSELDADAAQQQRFVHEAAVLGRLEHPNIVPIHDIGRDTEGQLYYSMKLVKGRTLQSILDGLREGDAATASHYTLDRLLTIFRKVCDAMAFAHANGIIHRDLKPENIMVGEFGEVLVMDWGLAKFLHEDRDLIKALARSGAAWEATLAAAGTNFGMTMDGDVMGTPQYMSPEQAEGRVADMDARSDIFSLGGILYCILTLRPPVEGKTLKEVLDKVATGRITPPSTHGTTTSKGKAGTKGAVLEANKISPLPHMPGGKVPGALSAVAMKALTLSVTKRYQSVAAFSADVEKYQSGFATSAENAGAWKQFTLLIKRNKAAAFGIAAVLVVGGTLGTQAVIAGRRATQAIAELKKSAPALLQLAESEADSQRFASALDKLDAALALDPALLRARWQRAWVLLALERWNEAVDALRLAKQHDPSEHTHDAFLPVMEALAAAPDEAARFTPDRTNLVFKYLSLAGATGELNAISKHLVLSAGQKLQLVRTRLDNWLGKGIGYARIEPDGTITVGNLPQTIESLEPLRGMPIAGINLPKTNVKSLEPLSGMRLTTINFSDTHISDLSPLRGMPLTSFGASNADYSDLSPLAGMPLVELFINGSKVKNLGPIRGCPLQKVNLISCPIIDLTPLRGAPLKDASLGNTQSGDLSFLADAPIEILECGRSLVSDLTPLHGKPLTRLLADQNPITDLRPLAGLPLIELDICFSCSANTDFSPLLELRQLEKLRLSPIEQIKTSIEPLRRHPSLKYIASGNKTPYRPVADFWKEYDAQPKPAGKK